MLKASYRLPIVGGSGIKTSFLGTVLFLILLRRRKLYILKEENPFKVKIISDFIAIIGGYNTGK